MRKQTKQATTYKNNMTKEEEWVKTALSNDSVVVEMLLRLHQAKPPAAPPRRKRGAVSVLHVEWSVRQRRSKQAPIKKGDTTRGSPTTPLSWSGATSVSDGSTANVGFEEFSNLSSKPIGNVRSKVVATGEATTSKRSRKKKTLAELKEEESFLLRERRNLKNKLATLCLSFEKTRAENESLKRMKLDVLSQQTMETVRPSASQETLLNQTCQMKVLCDPSCMIVLANGACNEVESSPPHGSSEVQEDGNKDSSFLLPDLNLPFDDDLGLGNLYGVS